MAVLRQRWERFWFEPSNPTDLGVCRLLFFGIFFTYYLSQDLSEWATVSQAFWIPISYFRDFHLPVLPREVLDVFQGIWKAALALSCVGLWTRVSTLTTFVLGVYFIGLPHNFGKIHHLDAVVLLTCGIFALSRCGDGWSVDRLVRASRGARPAASGEYTWPIRLVWTLMALAFFGAGVSKLRHSGLAWIFSENMTMVMMQANTPLSARIAQFGWLCRLIAAGTVLFETGAPLALASRRARWVIMPGLFLMQVGIRVVMHVRFHSLMVCYLFWVPWQRLGRWLTAPLRRRASHAVFYDGACGLCQGTVGLLRSLDVVGRITYWDAVNDWPAIRRNFLHLDQAACLKDMHVTTARGRTLMGFDAYRALAWSLPLGWPLLPFLYLPGVAWAGRRLYGAIAAQRSRASCPMPVHPPTLTGGGIHGAQRTVRTDAASVK